MKSPYVFSLLMVASSWVLADSLPVITGQPQNLIGSGSFSVVSANATAFQWRFNGTDIPDATNSTLARSATDPTGYYMVVVKNAVGWVPSHLVYLARGPGGYVPFSNYGNSAAQANYQLGYFGLGGPLTNGYAQVVAGPELDQMQPIGDTWDFYPYGPPFDGYFDASDQLVPNVSPGDTIYYGVNLTYPTSFGSYTQPSRTLKLVAGGGAYPVPSADNLRFPIWPEWPEPVWFGFDSTPTNQVRVPGETVSFTNSYFAYTDFGIPTVQWRKDGKIIPGATNFVVAPPPPGGNYKTVFTVTNVQPADAGVYDVSMLGNRFINAPKIFLSVQVMNGPGLLQSPRLYDTNFVCDLLGVAGRNYMIQRSGDLLSWSNLFTLPNLTGTVTFTNPAASEATRYYRARLLP